MIDQYLAAHEVMAGCESVEQALHARGLLAHATLAFSTDSHSTLRAAVAEQLRVPPAELGRLHELEEQAPRKNSRRTKGKRKDEVALARLYHSQI